MFGELKIVENRDGGLNVEPLGLDPVRRYSFRDLRLFVHDLMRVIERYEKVMFSVGTFTFFLGEDEEILTEVELWREIAEHFDCIVDFDCPFVLWDAFDVRRKYLGMIG